jgi:hypothetical protein
VTYLAACATYRDEAPYLREWIEFHRIVGVERFFLYDTGSTDDHGEVLAPYVDRGIVTVEHWPGEGRQNDAINHCLAAHADVLWIAFIDLDEFLFSPDGDPVPELLRDFEDFPGVGVNLVPFSTSGLVKKPAGLVIRNYVWRGANPEVRWVKNIVQPARAKRCLGAHAFEFDSGQAVDVAKRPLDGWRSQSRLESPLRINHYYTKSLEELQAKYARTRADTGELRPPLDLRGLLAIESRNIPDEAILRYVPALWKRLRGGLAAGPEPVDRPVQRGRVDAPPGVLPE